MAKEFVRIIEDIEEALAREVRRILFFENRTRREAKRGTETPFRESYDVFTGELKRQPLEPRFFDDTAQSVVATNPRFDIQLLKLYEDLETKRLLPAVGLDDVEVLPGPGAYEMILGGRSLITTDGGSGSTVELTNRKILDVQTTHVLRIKSGNNQGTYKIASISLNGNGPHTITLSNTLVDNLPEMSYNKDAGTIVFTSFVDLQAVKAGDELVDAASNSFTITAVNASTSALSIAPGSALATGIGARIDRVGDVLQNDDVGEPQAFLILDPASPVPGKGTKYRRRSQLVPYTFLYYIKITSREREDHTAVANRLIQVMNPPRGSIQVIIRSDESAEALLKKNIQTGDTVLLLEDAKKFYVGEKIRLFNNLAIGEELTIKSVNNLSNSLTVSTPVTGNYNIDHEARVVSNTGLCVLERDFRNHVTEDQLAKQLWIHRFTYRIEGWIEARIPDFTTEQTFVDTNEISFIEGVIEDFEENELAKVLCP